MSNRDDFEAAYGATTGTDTLVWYLKEHRASEDLYLFESEQLTGMVNAAWWGWRAGQATVPNNEQEVHRVIH